MLTKCIIVLAIALQSILPTCAQNTNFGIPSNSPAVLWPRGFSQDYLGFDRLYPNGPEFGLSTTVGGFGLIGSGPVSAIGATRTTVQVWVRQEQIRPYTNLRRLTDIFNAERGREYALLNVALMKSFSSELQRGATLASTETGISGRVISPAVSQSNDFILRDQPASPDSILNPNL